MQQNLTKDIINKGYLKTDKVIKAFSEVDRVHFLPEEMKQSAYLDMPLPIGDGQTISAPHMVAIMTEHLNLKPTDKVLEVGTGSGYQAAVISKLAKEVHTVEIKKNLYLKAKKTLKDRGYENVYVYLGDASTGLKEKSPYDKILVTAAAPELIGELHQQLKEEGILLMPSGSRRFQTLYKIVKKDGASEISEHGGCVFVPLTGKRGWS